MRVAPLFRLSGVPRAVSVYLSGAVLSTFVWFLAFSLAPTEGFTRSYYYPLPRDADPIALDVGNLHVIEERADTVDLTFIDELARPTREYFVRWRGVWFSPRQERVKFSAGADDGVIVRVDGEILLERHPAVGMSTEDQSVELEAGAHTLEIDHWQRRGARQLEVQWAPVDGEPALLDSRVFLDDPGAFGYWLHPAATALGALALLVWIGGPVVLIGWMAWQRVSALSAREIGTRLQVVTLPALLGPSQVLLFGPWTVHATNRAEFLVPFWNLAPRWIGLLGLTGGLLVTIGLVLSPRGFQRYVAGLVATGLLLWAQGNLLVADYGLLDGGGLDLAPHAWRTTVEVGLWIAALGLGIVFARAFVRLAPTASGLLMTLQAAVLLLSPLAPTGARPSSGDAAERWSLPPDEIYELSTSNNVIHIVLDSFSSYVFAEILDTDRRAMDQDWSGFTFYRDHLGAFRNTWFSMPAMLTGIAWRNDTPLGSYMQGHPTVFHAFGQQGYRVRSLTSWGRDHPADSFPGAESSIRYTIPAPYGTYRDYIDSASAQLLDLSLFRHAPHGAKARVYREGEWLIQSRTTPDGESLASLRQPYTDTVFLREFAERITTSHNTPVYTFVHVIIPHVPLVTDADCAYVGHANPLTNRNYQAQARCALRVVEFLFARLRELDLYDRSAIVVTSDHGEGNFPRSDSRFSGRAQIGVPLRFIEAVATPVLLVKPYGARGPVRTSDAPTALTDIPATLLDLAGLPNALGAGTSVLALDPAGRPERTYAFHAARQSEWVDALHLFSVNGRVTDPGAWRYQRSIYDPPEQR